MATADVSTGSAAASSPPNLKKRSARKALLYTIFIYLREHYKK
jgi:hypothetical protein